MKTAGRPALGPSPCRVGPNISATKNGRLWSWSDIFCPTRRGLVHADGLDATRRRDVERLGAPLVDLEGQVLRGGLDVEYVVERPMVVLLVQESSQFPQLGEIDHESRRRQRVRGQHHLNCVTVAMGTGTLVPLRKPAQIVSRLEFEGFANSKHGSLLNSAPGLFTFEHSSSTTPSATACQSPALQRPLPRSGGVSRGPQTRPAVRTTRAT